MILINRFIPFLSALAIFISFELLFIKPRIVWGILVVIFFIIFISTWKLVNRSLLDKEFWGFFITPFLFVEASIFLSLFLEHFFLEQFLVLAVTGLHWYLFENIFNFYYKQHSYQPYAIENIFSYLNLMIVFLVSTSFFGIVIFLDYSIWFLSFFILLLGLLVGYQTIWVSKITLEKSRPTILILGLILAETFWVINYLPSSHFVNGLIVTVIFYVIINLTRYYFLKNLSKDVVRRHLIIGSIVLLLTLVTARWV